MNIRPYQSVEARSATALNFKVAAKKAAGWVIDGPVLQVTDFCHRRPITRYCQPMIKAPSAWTAMDWNFA